MQIGTVIRKYRKEKNMTQEEMANRLGVTAPAVNKWENGNSCPDITLLGPIARLLDITPDILLSFKEDLTPEEINSFVKDLNDRLRIKSYEEVFRWAKKKTEEYPGCGRLLWQIGLVLDGWRLMKGIEDKQEYDAYIRSCYLGALESGEEDVRCGAAEALYAYYIRKEQFDKAEECLEYFSIQNPDRKRKQAQIYGKANRIREAYQAYEELLFSNCQRATMILYGMFQLAMKEQDKKRAEMLMEKQLQLTRLFEMGKYHELSWKLELARGNMEAEKRVKEELLSSVGSICDFQKSPLYEHMEFREIEGDFYEDLKDQLKESFQKEGRKKDGCQAEEPGQDF